MPIALTAILVVIIIAGFFTVPELRKRVISRGIMMLFRRLKILPRISGTERAALEAGDVWVDRDLFSGRPDLRKLATQPWPHLTDEELAFLDGPVEELCKLVDDWQCWRERDIPPEAWEHIKRERFWGMIIPKEYGGLGFSAYAHSEVIMKLTSRSSALAITVMVPNSLGPAELLIHYGTRSQKQYYLPRLARGEEVPCFALTEPEAGSDASSIQSKGTVFSDSDGALFLRLNWNKRWITLGAVSTLIGLAFQLEDPENLLGRGVKPGISCALIPRETPGVVIDRRHDPLGVPFYNSPTQGHDVVVPIAAIIGGAARAGQGWAMLMESLAAGRGISLPAQSAGTTKLVARVASAHATIRKQFHLPIGEFEGVAEPLARIAASAYAIDAARRYACGALNLGIRPPVITAILKYLTTELNRRALNDGMDILGGQGITLGPRNPLASFYIGAPIPITVEGANILTRTLITFGQGALRAHPYALAEVVALETGDLAAFDKTIWAHVGHIARNGLRAGFLTLTRGAMVSGVPRGASPNETGQDTGRYWKKLSWASAQFAWLTDLFMGTLGGKLRLREALTGRFADALAWMFVLTACLRRFEAEGSRKADLPFLRWSAEHACARIQEAFEGILANARVPGVGWFLRGPWRWLVRACPLARDSFGPDDRLTHTVAELIRVPDVQRDYRIAGGIFISRNPDDCVAELERVFRLCFESNALLARRRHGERLTLEEEATIARAETARLAAIQVDSFTQKEYARFDRVEENPNPAFPDTHPEAA